MSKPFPLSPFPHHRSHGWRPTSLLGHCVQIVNRVPLYHSPLPPLLQHLPPLEGSQSSETTNSPLPIPVLQVKREQSLILLVQLIFPAAIFAGAVVITLVNILYEMSVLYHIALVFQAVFIFYYFFLLGEIKSDVALLMGVHKSQFTKKHLHIQGRPFFWSTL